MRTRRKLLGWLGLLAVAVLAAGGWELWRLVAPYRGFSGEVFVEFPRGTSSQALADRLAGAGVVRSRWDFLLARLADRGRYLQAGEYRFQHPASAIEVYDRIARGDIFYYELVVPEGKNLFDIGAIAEQMGLFPAAEFVAAARNPESIRDLDPKAPSLEGYLFPNTYRLSRHTTPAGLCRIMTDKFREVWK
jgi:UPF0755 protein